jgi:hypothetical protein
MAWLYFCLFNYALWLLTRSHDGTIIKPQHLNNLNNRMALGGLGEGSEINEGHQTALSKAVVGALFG